MNRAGYGCVVVRPVDAPCASENIQRGDIMSRVSSAKGTRKIIRIAGVMAAFGLSRTTIWRRVRAGTLPPPVALGPNSVGWFDDEIQEAQDSLPRVNYAPNADAA